MIDESLPLISVIIPTFNRAAFLPTALDSVYAQTGVSVQVIVVDDGSTDETSQVMQAWAAKVTYLYQPNRGPAAARNRGLAAARGEWVAFLDSDDQWVTGRLGQQLALAAAYPTAQIIWGMLQVVRLRTAEQPAVETVGGPTLQTQLGSALFRRLLFDIDNVGRFDEALRTAEDVDWFCRAFERGVEVVAHQDVVALYLWHEHNLVANQAGDQGKAAHGLLHALARSLRRRRQQANGITPSALSTNIRMVHKAGNKTTSKAMATAEVEASLSW